MRRKIFQDVLPDALAIADEIVMGPVSRAQLLEEVERLSPESIAESLIKRGRPAKAFESAAAIAVDWQGPRSGPRRPNPNRSGHSRASIPHKKSANHRRPRPVSAL